MLCYVPSSLDALEYAPATYYPLNYALFGIFGILLGSTVLALLAIALIRNVLPACRSRVGHMNGLVPGDVDKATDRAVKTRRRSTSSNKDGQQTVVTPL